MRVTIVEEPYSAGEQLVDGYFRGRFAIQHDVPQISPFSGLLSDQARVGPLERVTTPPYDTISAEDQYRFRRAGPHNIVRLDLGEQHPADDDVAAKYRRAASELRRWREDGVLSLTPRPGYFPYEMRFALRGVPRRVHGLICQVELEPWGGSIVPYERTMVGPVEGRLQLLQAVRANLSAAYAVFPRRQRSLSRLLDEIMDLPPTSYITDESGVEHRMWTLEGARDDLTSVRPDDPLLIADGHHRFAVALRFREEMRARHGPGPWDQMMMLVVDAATEDPPVLPVHRVLASGWRLRERALGFPASRKPSPPSPTRSSSTA